MNKKRVAIIGASGYTGVELIRILLNHKEVEISCLVANSNANQHMHELYQHLSIYNLPILQKIEEVDFQKIDVLFGCLPHSTSQEIFKKILSDKKNSHLKIIDLSADFRLDDANDYLKWYDHNHIALELQKDSVYGLSEINRNNIKNAKIVACPGCYPTSILLPLIPLLENNLISKNDIVIDSKSGVSGAGRSVKQSNLFCEINESFKAYSIGNHRHIGEIEQELSKASKDKIYIDFTPHLLPINRGILSTIYVKMNKNSSYDLICEALEKKYKNENFVKLVKNEPSIKDVINTNLCLFSIKKGRVSDRIIIVSAIDNLCKGASGQAVQNMNIIFNFDEKTGLNFTPLFP